MQGSGIPGVDMGSAIIKMNDDGSFNLLVGATDLGTGSDTILAQISAEVLHVPVDKIVVYSSDTDFTPFDPGAYASSTTYISGMAVKKASEDVLKQILTVASKLLDSPVETLKVENGGIVVSPSGKKVTFSDIALHSLYAENQFQISATASHVTCDSPPPFGAQFVELEIDTETGQVKVKKVVTVIDCGVPINPKLAKGQVEGAIATAIGYALTERMIFDENGKMLNPNLRNYKIQSIKDIPEMITEFVETFEPTAPFGAKSVAEIPTNGIAPAIANAIYDAIGIRLRELPFTPEKVLKALKSK
jgi:putative selenate reductase molybdopterin-binding subunit